MKKLFFTTIFCGLLFVGCANQCDPTYIYVDRNITIKVPVKCKHESCVKGAIYDLNKSKSYTEQAKYLKANILTEKEYQFCLEDSIAKCENN